jgi:hypothetical protein
VSGGSGGYLSLPGAPPPAGTAYAKSFPDDHDYAATFPEGSAAEPSNVSLPAFNFNMTQATEE